MRRVYLIHGDKVSFDLSNVIFAEDRIQGTEYNSGTTVTVYKHNIAYIEG